MREGVRECGRVIAKSPSSVFTCRRTSSERSFTGTTSMWAGSTRVSVMAMALFGGGPDKRAGRRPCVGVYVLEPETLQRKLPWLDARGASSLCGNQRYGQPVVDP